MRLEQLEKALEILGSPETRAIGEKSWIDGKPQSDFPPERIEALLAKGRERGHDFVLADNDVQNILGKKGISFNELVGTMAIAKEGPFTYGFGRAKAQPDKAVFGEFEGESMAFFPRRATLGMHNIADLKPLERLIAKMKEYAHFGPGMSMDKKP